MLGCTLNPFLSASGWAGKSLILHDLRLHSENAPPGYYCKSRDTKIPHPESGTVP